MFHTHVIHVLLLGTAVKSMASNCFEHSKQYRNLKVFSYIVNQTVTYLIMDFHPHTIVMDDAPSPLTPLARPYEGDQGSPGC